MAGPDERAARAKAGAEARFTAKGGKDALSEAAQRAAAEREKTARLRAQRLARDEAERAAAAAAPKPARKVPAARRGGTKASG